MPYDLIIRDGMVVDGSGFSRYRADVAVMDGRIAEIGRIRGSARRDHRRRGALRHSGDHRSPHALRRPALLGPALHVLHLAWGHDRAHRQLRADARPAAPRAPGDDAGHLLLRRGPPGERTGRRAALDVAELRRVPEGHRHWARRQHDAPRRPQPAAPLRHGRRSLGPRGHARRDCGHARAAARRARGGRVGLEHHRFADARRAAGATRADATRDRRGAHRARPDAGRVQPGRHRDPAAGRWPAHRGGSAASPRRRAGQRPARLLPGLRRSARGATWKERRGRARSSTICSGSFPSIRASRSSGRPTSPISTCGTSPWRMPLDERVAFSPIPASARRCARRPRSGSAAGPACSGGSSSGTRSPSARSSLARNRALEGRTIADLARNSGKHVADAMLDLSLDERLETEFSVQSARRRSTSELADYVKTGPRHSVADRRRRASQHELLHRRRVELRARRVGARAAAPHPRGRDPPLHLPAGAHHGLARPRPRARGHGGRPRGLRSGPDRHHGGRDHARRPERLASPRAAREGRRARHRREASPCSITASTPAPFPAGCSAPHGEPDRGSSRESQG